MRSTLLVLFVFQIISTPLLAQLPVLKGKSATHAGMLYYDIHDADDKRPRMYEYTICPDGAGCMTLDFTLVQSKVAQDFIKVYAGASTEAEMIGTLGGTSKSKLMQVNGGCITFTFQRDRTGLHSTWTALWRSDQETDCINPTSKNDDCPDVQEICGPEFHETFHYFSKPTSTGIETPGACLENGRNQNWYKFKAQKDGDLAFEILPDNGFDDYDWVLWRADPNDKAPCPVRNMPNTQLACNYAAGRGPAGATGMGDMHGKGERGDLLQVGAEGSPYCKAIPVKRGDIFFLLINDYSDHSTGFRIRFDDVVLECDNADRDFLHLAGSPPKVPSILHPRDIFSKYSKITRIDLDEKGNSPLATCSFDAAVFDAALPGMPGKPMTGTPQLTGQTGLVAALLNGLKTARIRAYDPNNFSTPVHYGDLLEFVEKHTDTEAFSEESEFSESDSIYGVARTSWWNRDEDGFAGFTSAIEVITDEMFDKASGKRRQQIRFLRLIWQGLDGEFAYYVAVFRYADVRELLDRISAGNSQNDVSKLSLRDYLEGQMYQGVMVWNSLKPTRGGPDAQFNAGKLLQLENYVWER